MSDGTSEPGGVSPTRKKVSACVLITLLVVLLVEIRAGAGHSMSGKALQEACPDGVFNNVMMSDVDAMMTLAPSRTVVRETPEEVEYRYGWFSLLRPLLQRPDASLYVVSDKNSDPPSATRFNTEAPTAKDIANAKKAMDYHNNPPEEGDDEDGMGGDGGMGGEGGGERGPRPDGDDGEPRQRPPIEDGDADDADGDDAPSSEESEVKTDAAPAEESTTASPADSEAASAEPKE